MRKLSLFVFVLLAAVCAVPASACNQRCNWITGDCETVGWTTYQACETWSGTCVDVPVSGCRGGQEVSFMAALGLDGASEQQAAACEVDLPIAAE